MREAGLSPAQLTVVDDEELEVIPLGDDLPSTMPKPDLNDGDVVESESGVWRLQDSKLQRVLDPVTLSFNPDFDASKVTFLPDSLLRAYS